MEQDLRALLLAGLTGMTADRLNWGEHPQGAAGPYVVLYLVSWNMGHTQQGPDGLEQARVQVDCYADTFGAARGLARQVMGLLDGYRGGQFQAIFSAGMRMSREADENGGEAIYRASLDFIIHWRNENAG